MRRRASLTVLMGLVALIAVGLGMMKVATPDSSRLIYALALIVYLVATVGAIVRKRRSAWVGFAVFGWAYAVATLPSLLNAELSAELPNFDPVGALVEWMYPKRPAPVNPFPFEVAREGDRYVKFLLGEGLTPFSPAPEDAKAIDSYLEKVSVWHNWYEANSSAYRVGRTFLGLTFALGGALTGHLLGDRSRNTCATSRIEIPTLPG
jgi:hypothetical protein